MDDEIEVPPFFLCPISLQLMKDPVILSTGITYDRRSIERWIFTEKNSFCPVTKQQLLSASELTPSHTLRRLIQSWCTVNATHGVERFPTPKPQVDKSQILGLLNDAKSPELQIKCLRRLKSIASASETNKRCLESAAGAVDFLASVMKNANRTFSDEARDEALGMLCNLRLSEAMLKSMLGQNGEFVGTLILFITRSSHSESRTYALNLCKSILKLADPITMNGLKHEFFVELVQILKDQISKKATKTALQMLITACKIGRNQIKAVEAGSASVLIDLLLDCFERRTCELMLTALEQLCRCAEGRAALVAHGAGVAVVSKKMLRVLAAANERAVRILYWVAKFSAAAGVVQGMAEVGAAGKLVLMLQVDCGGKTKERAREILKLHAKAWKNSVCISNYLISSYPS